MIFNKWRIAYVAMQAMSDLLCTFFTFYGPLADGWLGCQWLFSALLELTVLHEVILHDVIANKRLTTRLGCWLDRKAAKRMEEFRSRWREFNVGIVQSAREASQVCPAERIYRGVEKGDLKPEEVRTVHPQDIRLR
jgi:hypothetical protein